MASSAKIQKALTRLNKAKGEFAHLVAMSELFGALREYALKYGYKMRDLHELNKAVRRL
jgi:hypothetical protein